jgi:AcrR family transcriptional regulator
MQEHFDMPSRDPGAASAPGAGSARTRILDAAFEVLRTRGYGATQTREIAARAKVSKRDIYRQFGSKDGIFAALIAARAERMRGPALEPKVDSREAFRATLHQVGATFLEQLYDPAVVSMFRLAIASAEGSPGLARILERTAFQPIRRALADMMARAVDAGVVTGDPSRLAVDFVRLLTGGAHVSILLGIAKPPRRAERARHSAEATASFLRLFGH